MMTSGTAMTPTDLIAASSSVLEAGGYRPIREGFQEWNTPSTRLFEGKYNVVGVAVFSTMDELLSSWADLQGALVQVISCNVGQTEGKAWDGYLVLLTTGIAPSSDTAVEALRYDTTRLRKLVATGSDLAGAGDVERLLRPLLPLRLAQDLNVQAAALDRLPRLLADQGVNPEVTKVLVKAFIGQEPLMESLHRLRRPQ